MRKNLILVMASIIMSVFVGQAGIAEVGTCLGQVAPPLEGTDINGLKVSLADANANGKFILVDFWASWCGPCMDELPRVVEFYQGAKSERFDVISVSLDTEDTLERLNKVIVAYGVGYPVIYDGGGWDAKLAKEWGIRAIPATFLVAPNGRIVLRNIHGEEGLALAEKIVALGENFVMPEFVVRHEPADDWAGFRLEVEMPAVKEAESLFFVMNAEFKEEEEFFSRDIAVNLSPGENDGEVTISLEPMEEAEEAWMEPLQGISASYELIPNKDRALLKLKADFGKSSVYVYYSVDYFSKVLEELVNISYAYVSPPRKEKEE